MQKVFKLNKNNKIEFTREELKALLDEVYQNGYQEGKNENWYWNSPWLGGITYTPQLGGIICTTTATNQTSGDCHINIPEPSSYN